VWTVFPSFWIFTLLWMVGCLTIAVYIACYVILFRSTLFWQSLTHSRTRKQSLLDNRDGFVTRGGFDTSWNYFTVANARTREAIGQQGEAFTNLLWNAQRSDQDQDRHCVVS